MKKQTVNLVSVNKVNVKISYRNCLICDAPLVGKTVKQTQRKQADGWCGCTLSKVEREVRKAKKASKNGGSVVVANAKNAGARISGVHRLPAKYDRLIAERIEMIVANAKNDGARDVVREDRVYMRVRKAHRVG
jgi:ribosomal protein L22